MKTIGNYLLIFTLLLTAASCKKDKKHPAAEAQVLTDVSYGNDNRQKMDVYLPSGRDQNTPVMLFLHGGGFVAGDKAEFSAQAQQLSHKGFVVINVNYRLVDMDGVMGNPIVHKPSNVKIADQLTDVQMAVNLAVTKSAEWNIRTENWGIAGHSAGGTLAMLYAYGDKNGNGRIKVVGNWAGATNFGFTDESEILAVDPRIAEVLYRAIGAEAKNANKLAYMAASPFWLAYQGRAIATINIRPEGNVVFDMPDGSKAEYENFTAVLNSKGVPNKWVEVAGADHGFSRPGNWDLVTSETSTFFHTKL